MKRYICILAVCLAFSAAVTAQQEILLYPGGKAGVSNPSVTVWLPSPDKATGKAVIICPGGGYGNLVIDREGHVVAKEFNKAGVAAFVLKYRIPDKKLAVDQSSYPLQDAQTAIKLIRQRAGEWQVASNKIGIMGFSAGGHLAATAGTHYNTPAIENPEGTSLRPDFMILIYPVISFSDKFTHTRSRANLIGESPTQEKIDLYSNELHVDKTTPPTLLEHGSSDATVNVSNSIVFYEALVKNGVSAEMHIYANGRHGFPKTPPFEEWFGRCLYWVNNL